jgi:hypothetical protein
LADRGTICYEDQWGFVWDLDLAKGVILHGTVNWYGYLFRAYGWRFGDEMFLWSNSDEGVALDFVYTGVWDGNVFYGAWTNEPPGGCGSVMLWPCGQPPPEKEYYAVIAGEGWTCAYADDDAYDLYDVLVAYPNWDPANILLLVSTWDGSLHDCTRDNIQEGIAWMASVADEDDVCLFWYSGHGGYMNDVSPYDEADGYDEYICPEGGNIIDDELGTWMSAISGVVLAGFDSCFSGGMWAHSDGLISRSLPNLPEVELTDGDGFERDLDQIGWNVLCASEEWASAYGSSALQHGVFTYYFVQGLWGPADTDADGDVDTPEIFYYTYPLVVAYTDDIQHPCGWWGTYPDPDPAWVNLYP